MAKKMICLSIDRQNMGSKHEIHCKHSINISLNIWIVYHLNTVGKGIHNRGEGEGGERERENYIYDQIEKSQLIYK